MDINLPELHRTDHQQHFVVGAAITAGTTVVVDLINPDAPRIVRILVPLMADALISGAKEVYDYHHPDSHTCETGDFLAGMFGGFAVTVFSWEG